MRKYNERFRKTFEESHRMYLREYRLEWDEKFMLYCPDNDGFSPEAPWINNMHRGWQEAMHFLYDEEGWDY